MSAWPTAGTRTGGSGARTDCGIGQEEVQTISPPWDRAALDDVGEDTPGLSSSWKSPGRGAKKVQAGARCGPPPIACPEEAANP